SEDLSSSHNENNKRKTSTASKGGKPKILSIQEYEAELDLLTNEPKSSDDTDTGEYFSDEDDDNDKNEIKSFTLPINLSMEPDNKQYWQSKIRTAPNPEYLEEWKFQIPLVTIHKSTLICCIVGFFGNEEYLCGEAFLPFENLNLNIENILTVNFQPIHVLPVTHDLQLTKTEVETDDKSKIATSKLTHQDRPSICPQNENAIIFNTRLSKVLLTLRLSQNTGRFECCIYVKLFIRTEEDGLINKAHSASHQQQSTIHMNETFAFYIKPYQIGRITVEFSLFKRKPFNKRIIIGTCKIGKYNTSINELEHWERVLATKDQVISQWHKFYPIAITPPEMTLKMED
ncbi:synaptotagmin-14/16, partial [Schistosoma bovis]